jgi:hypothetical protein
MKEPTAGQCSAKEVLERTGERVTFACWYPQMGGYVGKCVVELDASGCFDAHVWHDGEFPFDGGEPRVVHHCDAEQFIRFGELVRDMASQPSAPPPTLCPICAEQARSAGKLGYTGCPHRGDDDR